MSDEKSRRDAALDYATGWAHASDMVQAWAEQVQSIAQRQKNRVPENERRRFDLVLRTVNQDLLKAYVNMSNASALEASARTMRRRSEDEAQQAVREFSDHLLGTEPVVHRPEDTTDPVGFTIPAMAYRDADDDG